MAFVGAAPAAEVAAQAGAATQALQGVSGLAELGYLGTSNISAGAGSLLVSNVVARNALNNLGLAGPSYGLTPYDLAFNVEYATFINGLVATLGRVASAQTILGLGTSAQLANTGRRFLLSTYYGI